MKVMCDTHLKVESLLKGEITFPISICFDLEKKAFHTALSLS